MGSPGIPWDSYGWGPMGTPGIPWGSQGSHGDPRGVIPMNLCFPKDLHSRNLLGNSHGRQEISLSLSLSGLSGKEEIILWALWERGKGGNNKGSYSTYK